MFVHLPGSGKSFRLIRHRFETKSCLGVYAVKLYTQTAGRTFRRKWSDLFGVLSVLGLVQPTMPKSKMSVFDRISVIVIAVWGTLLGLAIAVTSDIKLSPLLLLIFPGLIFGLPALILFGATAGVIVTGLANGAICGLLMYGLDRLPELLAGRISKLAAMFGGRRPGGQWE